MMPPLSFGRPLVQGAETPAGGPRQHRSVGYGCPRAYVALPTAHCQAALTGGAAGSLLLDLLAMGPHSVAPPLDGQDRRAVQDPVEHGRGDDRVIENLAPGGDAAIGGEHDGAFQVPAGDDLEQRRGGFTRQRQVAPLVDDAARPWS
jgi:hypothetical protein